TFHAYFPPEFLKELKAYTLPYSSGGIQNKIIRASYYLTDEDGNLVKDKEGKPVLRPINPSTIRKWFSNWMIATARAEEVGTEYMIGHMQGKAVIRSSYRNHEESADHEYARAVDKFPIPPVGEPKIPPPPPRITPSG